MNILILGSGGREHAISDAYAKNKKIKKIFVLPGNALIEFSNKKARCLNFSITDFDAILKIIKKYKIDLVDVGQEDPLALGFVDRLSNLGIRVFGPTRDASEIEWSKEWARHFMVKYNLPVPKHKSFHSAQAGLSYLNTVGRETLYIKASGLALGKGAIKASGREEAISAVNFMKQFGDAGKVFLIEEAVIGEEFSAFAICDGESFKILGFAQDHKTVFNKDLGPNTGGMGALLSPSIITLKIIKEVKEKIFGPFIKGMKAEGRPYTGIIYLGGILAKSGVKIIEFNARWGDPEAEVIIPSITSDYLSLVDAALNKKLNKIKINIDSLKRLSVAGTSAGYPSDYSAVKGKKVFGLKNISKNVKFYGAGISKSGNDFVVSGGRVFHVLGEGRSLTEARSLAYGAISSIYIEGDNLQYRTDIGYRDLERIHK